MLWRAPALLGFAETVGFSPDQAVTAAAVALAASGGNDNYVATPWGGSERRYVGLWQVGADASDTDTITDLLDPYRNAQAAYGRWEDAGGAWDWSTGWQSGRWKLYLPAAQAAAVHPARVDTLPTFGSREP